ESALAKDTTRSEQISPTARDSPLFAYDDDCLAHCGPVYDLYSIRQGVELNTRFRKIAMLPKTAEYALRAIVWLAGNPESREAAGPLAERTKIPRRYLHKVLQALVHGGLVESQSGPGGGYRL